MGRAGATTVAQLVNYFYRIYDKKIRFVEFRLFSDFFIRFFSSDFFWSALFFGGVGNFSLVY